MNKAIYICVAAALVLASCSNDEIVERAKENAISFRSVVGLTTRAQNVTQDMLEKNGMYVTTFDENGSLVYTETHYELNGGVWMANPAKSWGAYDKLSFVLTSPKLDEFVKNYKLVTESADIDVTVDEAIPDQKDFLVAHLKDVSKTEGAVPVSLKHVFSSVEIWAKNTNDAFKYKVTGIRLCGVNKTGSINTNMAEATCNDLIDTRTYELTYETSPVTLTSDVQSLMGTAGNAILPPQPPLNENYKDIAQKWGLESPADEKSTYISVRINVTAKAGASIYPAGSTATNETYGWVSVPVPYEWESGKKYVYTLDFSEGAGRVDPNDPGIDVNPGGEDPDKAKDPNKAQPVLGGRIRFGVDVTEWLPNSKDVLLKDGDKFDVTVDDWGSETNGATVE